MKRDYYEILGISKNASQDEIKKAYRQKAHQYHPDKGSGDEAKFKEINEAYQILGNPEKRAQYDQFGQAFDGSTGGGMPNWDFSNFNWGDAGVDLGDLFGDLFQGGRADRSAKKSRRRVSQRGRDIGVTLEITLEEAFRGVNRDIELRKLVRCKRCNGEGSEPGVGRIVCKACGGAGEIKKTQRTFFGVFSHSTVCQTCQGEGKYPEQVCKDCSGEGRIRQIEKLSIPIPAGIEAGGLLRIYNKGEEGIRGGEAGDLEIRVLIKPHATFERKGANLYSEIAISFTQAVLGSSVEVKTIDGKVELKIPEGTQPGTVFKLREKGMPYSATRRGDHLVEVSVKVPKKISSKARRMLQDFGNEL